MKLRRTVEALAIPVGLLLAWEISGRFGSLPTYLSTPTRIMAAVAESIENGELPTALGTSLLRGYGGFFIGAALGMLFGLGAGLSMAVRNFFDPLVSFLYPIPKNTFLSVVLLIFGLGNASQIALVALAVFFPVFVASRFAVLAIGKTLVWSGENMGAGRTTIFFRVIIPAAAPELLAGLRVGLAHSFVVLFAAELIGARSGLGFLIVDGEEALRFDLMFVGILGFAIIGFASDRALMAIRKRVLRGQSIGTEERMP